MKNSFSVIMLVAAGMGAPLASAAVSVDLRPGRLHTSERELLLSSGAIALDVHRSRGAEAAEAGLLGSHWRLIGEARAISDGRDPRRAAQLAAATGARLESGTVLEQLRARVAQVRTETERATAAGAAAEHALDKVEEQTLAMAGLNTQTRNLPGGNEPVDSKEADEADDLAYEAKTYAEWSSQKLKAAVDMIGDAADWPAGKKAITDATDGFVKAARVLSLAREKLGKLHIGVGELERLSMRLTEFQWSATDGAKSATAALGDAMTLIDKYEAQRAAAIALQKSVLEQINHILSAMPNGAAKDAILPLAGEVEIISVRDKPAVADLRHKREQVEEKILAAEGTADAAIARATKILAATNAVSDAKVDFDGAVVVVAMRLDKKAVKLAETQKKLGEVKAYRETADLRDRQLRDQREKREALLRDPNTNADDKEKCRQDLLKIAQLQAKNDLQKNETAHAALELKTDEANLTAEKSVLGAALESVKSSSAPTP